MNPAATHPDSLPRRLAVYVHERFPLAAHLPLIALLFVSSTQVALAVSGPGQSLWFGAWVLLLAFLTLRLSDDDHDFEHDAAAHPDRPLPRGLLSRVELRWTAAVVVSALLGLSAALGTGTLLAALGCLAFIAAMRGLSPKLEGRPFLTAITHNPLLAGFTVLAGTCTTAGLTWAFGWYAATVCGAGLVFELGRKWSRYEKAAGRAGAGLFAGAASAFTTALLAVTLVRLPGAAPLQAAFALLPVGGAGLWLASHRRTAETFERAATVFLIAVLVTAALAAWRSAP